MSGSRNPAAAHPAHAKLTADLLVRCASSGTRRTKDDCGALQVLYCYGNALRSLRGVEHAEHLTQVYVQDNEIDDVAPLGSLRALSKLHIGRNRIRVVDGLQSLTCLTELHISHQKLEPGEHLRFAPDTVAALGKCLETLECAGNRMTGFYSLAKLRVLDASGNEITDIDELHRFLPECTSLREVKLAGNPVCKDRKYRDTVILSSATVSSLDGKVVLQQERNFAGRLRGSADSRVSSRSSQGSAKSDRSCGHKAGPHDLPPHPAPSVPYVPHVPHLPHQHPHPAAQSPASQVSAPPPGPGPDGDLGVSGAHVI
eukprot:m51a1_g9538 hypothetical protein (314) ;mRNA; r:833105-834482